MEKITANVRGLTVTAQPSGTTLVQTRKKIQLIQLKISNCRMSKMKCRQKGSLGDLCISRALVEPFFTLVLQRLSETADFISCIILQLAEQSPTSFNMLSIFWLKRKKFLTTIQGDCFQYALVSAGFQSFKFDGSNQTDYRAYCSYFF